MKRYAWLLGLAVPFVLSAQEPGDSVKVSMISGITIEQRFERWVPPDIMLLADTALVRSSIINFLWEKTGKDPWAWVGGIVSRATVFYLMIDTHIFRGVPSRCRTPLTWPRCSDSSSPLMWRGWVGP